MKKTKKLDFQKMIENGLTLKLVSVLVAILLWFGVAMIFSPTVDNARIRNVPITISPNNETRAGLGLEAVGGQTETVTVRVKGSREVVGALKPSDIVVSPVLTDVTGPGTYTLQLRWSKQNVMDDFEILGVSPEKMEFTFARVVSKKLTVEAKAVGLTAKDGYVLGKPTTDPVEITVKGPDGTVDKIERCVATVTSDTVLSRTYKVPAELTLYDADGNEVEKTDAMTFDVSDVEMTIPVLKKATLPLKVKFLNAPASIQTDKLTYELSAKEIDVAGPEETISKLEAINVGYINLLDFKYGEGYTFQIELPNGFVNLDSFDTVSVTFGGAYAGKSITVSNFSVINPPSNWNVTVTTKRIYGVQMAGLAADIAALQETNVVAEIDASTIDMKEGQYNVPVKLYATDGSTVWAAGSYEAVVEISAKK